MLPNLSGLNLRSAPIAVVPGPDPLREWEEKEPTVLSDAELINNTHLFVADLLRSGNFESIWNALPNGNGFYVESIPYTPGTDGARAAAVTTQTSVAPTVLILPSSDRTLVLGVAFTKLRMVEYEDYKSRKELSELVDAKVETPKDALDLVEGLFYTPFELGLTPDFDSAGKFKWITTREDVVQKIASKKYERQRRELVYSDSQGYALQISVAVAYNGDQEVFNEADLGVSYRSSVFERVVWFDNDFDRLSFNYGSQIWRGGEPLLDAAMDPVPQLAGTFGPSLSGLARTVHEEIQRTMPELPEEPVMDVDEDMDELMVEYENNLAEHDSLWMDLQCNAMAIRNIAALAEEAVTSLYYNPKYGALFIRELMEDGRSPEDLPHRRERCAAAEAKRAPAAGEKRARVEAALAEALKCHWQV